MKTLLQKQAHSNPAAGLQVGMVTRKMMHQITVTLEGQGYQCSPSVSRSSHPGQGERGDWVVPGDLVRFRPLTGTTGQIVEVLPRRNKLSRRSAVPMPGAAPFEQLIAANIDQVTPVFAAANPAPKWGMLDRYLALAEAEDLPALIVITKADLAAGAEAQEAGLDEAVQDYRRIGYRVILTSVVDGTGIDELRAALAGKISVFLGKSGVGKSALLNALQPGLGQRTGEVSQVTGKGKHTTTHLEMFPLESGGSLIDTPGVREFGLWDIGGAEMAYLFREFAPYLGGCRFGMGCRHDEEPDCAIRRAVVEGAISPRRYQSYLHLSAEAG